jgi:hypothetical protein
MKLETYPWNHIVTSGYYNEELFTQMRDELNIEVEKIKKSKRFVGRNGRNHTILEQHNKSIFFRSEDGNIVSKLPATAACLQSKVIEDGMLSLFSHYREYKGELETKVNINIIFDGGSYPIHDDCTEKVLTNVIFVAPEQSCGTKIYDKNKNYVKSINWEENTSLIFPPLDNITWHSYESFPNSYRITINQFLLRDI